MNRVIKYLMISDTFIFTGFGLIAPVLAIFIKEDLEGGTIFAAGAASAVFLLVKSAIQLPFSRYVDTHDRKLTWLRVGTALVSVVPLLYIFATHVNHIYIMQILYGIGSGLAYPTWLGLWSTHLDKGHESFEWSLYSTLAGLGYAATAAIGAAIAQFIGFSAAFVMVALMSFTGCLILFGLSKKDEKSKGASAFQHFIKRKVR
ncbi:MFS transporter [Patescibacteria group bacterium]|nr:MFS transporter [Patescibacteria group bacterium]